MPYQHLKREERYVIYHLVVFGLSYREIARRLDRAPSTIAREIKRNSGTFNYWHEHAQVKRNERASAAHRGRRRRPQSVFRYVEAGLREGWSPEMISRRLRRECPHQKTCASAMRRSISGCIGMRKKAGTPTAAFVAGTLAAEGSARGLRSWAASRAGSGLKPGR